MALVKFNHRPFDGSFNNLLDGFFTPSPVFFKNESNPWRNSVPVNIVEEDNGYRIDVQAPGFEKADFKVNIEKDLLTISAEKKTEEKKEDVKQKLVRTEFSQRSFKRSFTIDENIDGSAIEAKYVNGVLTLNLPKKEEVKVPAKQISIQ